MVLLWVGFFFRPPPSHILPHVGPDLLSVLGSPPRALRGVPGPFVVLLFHGIIILRVNTPSIGLIHRSSGIAGLCKYTVYNSHHGIKECREGATLCECQSHSAVDNSAGRDVPCAPNTIGPAPPLDTLSRHGRPAPAGSRGGDEMRHRWRKGNGWAVCQECGCRYRTGNVSRVYEWPDGRRTGRAEECPGMTKSEMDRAFVQALQNSEIHS